MSETKHEFDIEHWFTYTFWPTYPNDLCKQKGSKTPVLKKLKIKVKTAEKANMLLSALREQMRYKRKLKKEGEHQSQWVMPMVSTWVNAERWEDEIPSQQDIEEQKQVRRCACGAEALYSGRCDPCHEKHYAPHDQWLPMLREKFKEMGLQKKPEETQKQWIERLKDVSGMREYMEKARLRS